MPKKKEEATDNFRIWKQVDITDPKHTKKVNQRGGFTAICAQYQMQVATGLWGPYGTTWGVKNCKYSYLQDTNKENEKIIIEVCLDAVFYYPEGEFEIGCDIAYRPGNDSKKKLLTDLTTKALSKLGFSADVFMGGFDDNKYISPTSTGHVDVPRSKEIPPTKNAALDEILARAVGHEEGLNAVLRDRIEDGTDRPWIAEDQTYEDLTVDQARKIIKIWNKVRGAVLAEEEK